MWIKLNIYFLILIFLIFTFLPNAGLSLDQLHIDINDPIYNILEICSIRGILPQLTTVRPYNKNTVRELIEKTLENKNKLSFEETTFLFEIYNKYYGKASTQIPKITISEESDLRINLSNDLNFHSVNMIKGGLIGGIGDSLSYDMNVGIFLDKVDPNTFPPYDFTKKWDGFHLWFGEDKYSNGINDHFNFSWNCQPEISLYLFDSKANFKLARYRREWGLGDGSLYLSSTARPIEAFEGRVWLSSWAKFNFLSGILGNWFSSTSEQKMFSIHQIEFFPVKWFYISLGESVVYAKRFELSYLNPIMSYYMAQNIIGDFDNVAYNGTLAFTISPYVRFYFSLFIDEIEVDSLNQFFKYPKNQYAWQAGFKVPLPWLPFTLLTLQYTKIEPYCYTHYPQEMPNYTVPVNINYSNDGENIGYHLPPNSDEFLIKVFSYPLSRLAVKAQYQLIRHGTGDHENGQIEGDIDIWLDYGSLSEYPDKDFLHDGVYEWINILKLNGSYVMASGKVTLWAEYNYVIARNFNNIKGNDVSMNLVGFGFKIWIF